MEYIEHLIYKVKKSTINIGFSHSVYVTHVNSPHSFYVRPQDYDWYLSAVNLKGDRMTQSEVRLGTIAIFKSDIQGNYIRGKILSIEESYHPTICHMFAIDNGFVEKNVPLEKIWKPYYQFDLPPLAFHCQLANCLPKGSIWHECTIESMKGFLKEKVVLIVITNILPDMVIVELSVSTPGDFADWLAVTENTYYSYEDLYKQQQAKIRSLVMSCQLYPKRVLNVKDLFRVRMQAGSFLEKFFVAPVDEYNSYLQHRDNYTNDAQTAERLDPQLVKLYAAVGVFYIDTNKYERGMIRELYPNENKVKVELVDWGKVVIESIEALKPIPEQYMMQLPIAIYCSLHVNQYTIMSLSDILNLSAASYAGVELMISIEEIGDGKTPHLVTVYDIKK